MIKLASMISAAALFGLVAPSAVQAQSSCVGDCSNTGAVHVTDLVLGVNIALGTEPVSQCPAFDCQHNNMVTVTCLIQGVNNALNGCPGGPTPTPTRTGGATVTATPSPSPTPTATTGAIVRVFTIDSLLPMMAQPDSAPGSGIFNGFPLGGQNVAAKMSSGPLTLLLGPPDANGIASLALQSDVTISTDISLNQSCACLKLLAAGQSGEIDCDGGTAYDTQITQTTADGTGWTVKTHQGSPAGKGNGQLLLMGLFVDITGKNCVQADCEHATYPDPANQFPFTTTTSGALVQGAGTSAFTSDGAAFDCAKFGTSGSGGELVSGIAFNSVIGATSDTMRLSE